MLPRGAFATKELCGPVGRYASTPASRSAPGRASPKTFSRASSVSVPSIPEAKARRQSESYALVQRLGLVPLSSHEKLALPVAKDRHFRSQDD